MDTNPPSLNLRLECRIVWPLQHLQEGPDGAKFHQKLSDVGSSRDRQKWTDNPLNLRLQSREYLILR